MANEISKSVAYKSSNGLSDNQGADGVPYKITHVSGELRVPDKISHTPPDNILSNEMADTFSNTIFAEPELLK